MVGLNTTLAKMHVYLLPLHIFQLWQFQISNIETDCTWKNKIIFINYIVAENISNIDTMISKQHRYTLH